MLLSDSFFEGVEEFVEFEKLFVHADGSDLELLDFLGAIGEDKGKARVGRRRWKLRGAFFAVEDVVDVDADSFEFFAEDVADTVFSGDVGGDVGGVFGSYGLTEGYLGFKLLFDLTTEAFRLVGIGA